MIVPIWDSCNSACDQPPSSAVRRFGFRVDLGGCPPRPPTDPYVQNYRIRFLRPRFRYATSGLHTNPQIRKRVALQKEVEPLPGQVGCSRAATEPLAPDPLGPMMQAAERLRVPGDSVVPAVPAQLAEKLCVLPRHGRVPVPLTPPVELPQEPSKSVGGRLALHHSFAST